MIRESAQHSTPSPLLIDAEANEELQFIKVGGWLSLGSVRLKTGRNYCAAQVHKWVSLKFIEPRVELAAS
jgi:hypothetical protein